MKINEFHDMDIPDEIVPNSYPVAPLFTFNASPAVPIGIPSNAPAFVLNAISLFCSVAATSVPSAPLAASFVHLLASLVALP